MLRSLAWRLIVPFVVLAACSNDASRDVSKEPMRVHHEYDYLIGPSTHELYVRHRDDGPKEVAELRAALRRDSRVEVRRGAVIALTAALKIDSIQDCIAALDDPDPRVYTEAAHTLTVWGTAGTSNEDNPAALRALREHAPAFREVFKSPPSAETANIRYNAAEALRVIADPEENLVPLLSDPLDNVRSEGLRLVEALIYERKKTLGPADVAALDNVARTDSDPQLRWRAVTLVANGAPPDLSISVVSDALGRGDAHGGISSAVIDRGLTGTIPAIIAHLRTNPRGDAATEWIKVLVAFRATCAARVIASFLNAPSVGFPAEEALRELSGNRGTADMLAAWADAQREDVPPCDGTP